MGGFLRRQKYGICHRIFLEYSLAYSKIFHKKKKIETSNYEISDLTTRMVLAKGKKKKKSSLTVSLFNSLTDLTTRINLKTLFVADAI